MHMYFHQLQMLSKLSKIIHHEHHETHSQSSRNLLCEDLSLANICRAKNSVPRVMTCLYCPMVQDILYYAKAAAICTNIMLEEKEENGATFSLFRHYITTDEKVQEKVANANKESMLEPLQMNV